MDLRRYLLVNNITQQEFADKVGLSRVHLNEIINIRKISSVDTAKNISEASDGVVSRFELLYPNEEIDPALLNPSRHKRERNKKEQFMAESEETTPITAKVRAYYPYKEIKKPKSGKSQPVGSFTMEITSHGIVLKDCLAVKKKENYLTFLPSKWGEDRETGKRVTYTIFLFTDREKTAALKVAIREAGEEFFKTHCDKEFFLDIKEEEG